MTIWGWWKSRRRGSVSVRQATGVMVLTCVIAIVVSFGELLEMAAHERAKSATLVTGLLDMEEHSASTATWNLDDDLAAQVLAGLGRMREVEHAEILDDDGTQRARISHEAISDRYSYKAWLGGLLLGDAASAQRALVHTDSLGHVQPVGTLRITLAARVVGADFITYALTTLLANLVRSLILGVVLAWSLQRFLARPIVEISNAVRDVDPDRPMARPIAMPASHEDDELGRLVDGINSTLARLDQEQETLRHLATHDPLTGLPNRALLADRLERAVARAAQTGGEVSVLFLDLDRFKHVNDSLGHRLGDHLLQEVGRRLITCLDVRDTVGRLGGDEFLIVLEGRDDPSEVASLGARILHALNRIFDLEGHSVHTSTAIGIATYPTDGSDFETLLRAADTAMYSAKAEGTGRLKFFARDMTERAQIRLTMEADLRHAVDRGAFELHYQPKVDVEHGTLKGAEALVRWRHAGRLIDPGAFIPLAEETGLITAISAWVIEEACATLSRWQRRFQPISLAINLSSRDFADPHLPQRVADALSRHCVPPALLEVEITETSLMRDVELCARALSQLREIGVRIAVDDFGTGYSSLAYLRRLPIDVLKIDRAFIYGVPDDPIIASMVISLGKKMGLVTVAEGVENEAQRAWLLKERCDLMQGWLVARALPEAEMEMRFLRTLSRAALSG
jgi:diguanylate cyclase (GGDEF)-like protein